MLSHKHVAIPESKSVSRNLSDVEHSQNLNSLWSNIFLNTGVDCFAEQTNHVKDLLLSYIWCKNKSDLWTYSRVPESCSAKTLWTLSMVCIRASNLERCFIYIDAALNSDTLFVYGTKRHSRLIDQSGCASAGSAR